MVGAMSRAAALMLVRELSRLDGDILVLGLGLITVWLGGHSTATDPLICEFEQAMDLAPSMLSAGFGSGR